MQQSAFMRPGQVPGQRLPALAIPREAIIGTILVVALLAFELFNFDTTQFALENLLGQVAFAGIGWATILAIAFCAIDFAGLARFFTPEREAGQSQEAWFLMGAWFLGASMNALMTWWAVSLSLLSHPLAGNELLSRERLLQWVPLLVAVLVWLTRIMFIGALSVAGNHLFRSQGAGRQTRPARSDAGTSRPDADELPLRKPAPNILERRRPAGIRPVRAPAVPAASRPSYGPPGYVRQATPGAAQASPRHRP